MIPSPEQTLQQVDRTHPERKSPRMVNGACAFIILCMLQG